MIDGDAAGLGRLADAAGVDVGAAVAVVVPATPVGCLGLRSI